MEAKKSLLEKHLNELVANKELFTHTAEKIDSLSRTAGPDEVEAYVSETLGSQLPIIISLLEAPSSELSKAIEELGLEANDRAFVLALKEKYLSHRPQIQAANLYEQGYLNRITGVRHRAFVFLYSGTPAIDLTLRSFDRNMLRVVDTLDNALAIVAGISEGIATAWEHLQSLTPTVSARAVKNLQKQVDRVVKSIDRIQGVTSAEAKSVEQIGEVSTEAGNRGSATATEAPTVKKRRRGRRRAP